MKHLFSKIALFSLALLLLFRSSSITLLAKEETTAAPIRRSANSSLLLKPYLSLLLKHSPFSSLLITPAYAAEGSSSPSLLSSLLNFFKNLFAKPTTVEIINTTPTAPKTPTPAPIFNPPVSTPPTSTSNLIHNTTIINGVTEAELDSKLSKLDQELRSLISGISTSGNASTTVNNYITYSGGGGSITLQGSPSQADIKNIQNQITNITTTPGNPFNQSLNTTDSPTFNHLTLTGAATSTFAGPLCATTYYGDGSHLTGLSSFSTT